MSKPRKLKTTAEGIAPSVRVNNEPKRSRGNQTVHTAELAASICRGLADGLTLRQACKADDMPPESTVREWVLDDRNGFAAQYMRAREIGYHSMADELVEISDDGANDWIERETEAGRMVTEYNGDHVARSRLRVDSRKWLLSKALPKIYGDKVALSGPDGGAIPLSIVSFEIVRPKDTDTGSV